MKSIFFGYMLLATVFSYGQKMDNEKLGPILKKQADTIIGSTGNWKLVYKKIPMFCVTDEKNNRMRIIAPITDSANLDSDLLLDCLTANFHSALDVRYAISQNILWSAYIHPLKELTSDQVESALSQVYLAAINFGTTFSSTALLFGTENTNKKMDQNKKNNDPEMIKF